MEKEAEESKSPRGENPVEVGESTVRNIILPDDFFKYSRKVLIVKGLDNLEKVYAEHIQPNMSFSAFEKLCEKYWGDRHGFCILQKKGVKKGDPCRYIRLHFLS